MSTKKKDVEQPETSESPITANAAQYEAAHYPVPEEFQEKESSGVSEPPPSPEPDQSGDTFPPNNPSEGEEESPTFETMAAAMAADILSEFAHMSIDPNPNKPWKELPKETQDSMIVGVKAVMANPNITPEDNHNSWLTTRGAQGWQYGDSKNVDLKRSPDMVSWNELKPYSRTKNILFLAVVKAALAHLQV
jgi:hypothetical protein